MYSLSQGSARCKHCAEIFKKDGVYLWHRVPVVLGEAPMRCLSPDEMRSRNWSNDSGRWLRCKPFHDAKYMNSVRTAKFFSRMAAKSIPRRRHA